MQASQTEIPNCLITKDVLQKGVQSGLCMMSHPQLELCQRIGAPITREYSPSYILLTNNLLQKFIVRLIVFFLLSRIIYFKNKSYLLLTSVLLLL